MNRRSKSGRAKEALRRVVPVRLWDAGRVATGRASVGHEPRPEPDTPVTYEGLYEAHAKALPPDQAIGDGDFELIGRIELSVLAHEGLQPTSALLDLGCGTGRLAVHAVPYLQQGRYIGTDIAPTMLRHAETLLGPDLRRACRVELHHQPGETFPVDDASIDFLCAFSVFTHMEHEDTYRYLRAMCPIVRPGGKVLISCLPLELPGSRSIFLTSAADTPGQRWSKVRNVTTSKHLMEVIASMAGWRTVRWHDGDGPSFPLLGDGGLTSLGQSVQVLEHE